MKRKENTGRKNYIVGIGASAGGLEAINSFFDSLKEFGQLAFIIIQHLSPDYKSLLVELVGKHTDMKVLEAKDTVDVEPGNVYVIPNNRTIIIKNGKLHLNAVGARNIPNNAIDVFFESLANDQGKRAIAVLLSGTGSDGTKGIAHIKEKYGYVLVQDPKTAKFDGMPNMAIMSGYVDQVLSPLEMPQHIAGYILNSEHGKEHASHDVLSTEVLQDIFRIVFDHSGNDFSRYKSPTLIRRILKRMNQRQLLDPEAYVRLLSQEPDEAVALSQELIINVTRFFRDEEAFAYLSEYVIAKMVADKREQRELKVWICACSTGEEAYTIAILLDQYLQQHQLAFNIKVFATDIDGRNIEMASKNLFSKQVKSQIPPALFKRYFVEEGMGYSVIPRIRKQIVFAKHNVLTDPAFIHNDLICCRNMLIYVDKSMQEQILEKFHFALNPNGYLFLGKSETISSFEQGFETVNNKWKIYKRSPRSLQKKHWQALSPDYNKKSTQEIPSHQQDGEERFGGQLEKLLFEKMGYVALYVDQHSYEIKETMGNFSMYLSLPKKKLRLNLLSMAPEEFRFLLANAIQDVKNTQKDVYLRGLPFTRDDHNEAVDIHVSLITAREDSHLVCLLFMPAKEEDSANQATSDVRDLAKSKDKYVKNLESELQETRMSLQLALENMETVNEEFQSSNEELLSSNEELQSSNEELQSLNEELHTLNNEHQNKIAELVELNDDLNNYFKSTDIGQIFLDKELRIRKFTPQAKKLVNLLDSDIGRPIGHFSSNLVYDGLLEDIHKVMSERRMLELKVDLANGRTNLLRIFPFVRKDKILDGVVLTFVDISDVSQLNNIIKGVFDSSISPIFVLDYVNNERGTLVDLKMLAYNETAKQILLSFPDENMATDTSFMAYFGEHMDDRLLLKLMECIQSNRTFYSEIALEQKARLRFYEINALAVKDVVVMTFNDITSQKESLQKLRQNYNELITAKENLRLLNQSLEKEVERRTFQLAKSEERFRLLARATNDCIRDWDLVENKIWHSENYYNIFQRSKDSKQLQDINDWFADVHPSDVKRVRDGVFKAIDSGAEQWSMEYRFRKGDDAYEYVLERSFIINDATGVPYRIVSSIMDIGALKAAELANKELAGKKDEFLSIASHELKTPITSMKVSLQLIERFLKNGDSLQKIPPFVLKANQQIERLSLLIETLLDVSRVQSGKMQLDIQQFNLQDILNDSIYEVAMGSKHRIDTHGDINITLCADRGRIEQVLINFLTNAIKYSPDANQVDVLVEQDDEDVTVKVRDYGIGIPKEKLEMIFDRFFRVEDTAKQFSGLGLGLFISADIINRHGGKLGVDSQHGQGATFWFKLPKVVAN